MSVDLDEIEHEKELAIRRHRELKNSLKALAESLSKNNNDEIVEAISEQSELLKAYISAIKGINISSPEINLEVNQSEVTKSISLIGKNICQKISELSDKIDILIQPKEWIFDVKIDDRTQRITSVVANMSYIKPKYQA